MTNLGKLLTGTQVRRIARATWNWWTALAIVAVLIVFIAPLLLRQPGQMEAGDSVTLTKKMVIPYAAAQGGAAGRPELASAPLPPPKLKLNVQSTFKGESAGIQPASGTQRHVLGDRQLARKASLNLIVNDVDRALTDLNAIVRGLGGDVTKLDDQRPASGDQQHTADATIIVPAGRLDGALGRLTRLGGVRSEAVSAEDVTDQLVDGAARLRNLRRTENDMLKIMDRSGKIGEVLEVENRLSEVRDQIERLDAEQHALAARVATSTIEVHLEDVVTAKIAEPSIQSQLYNAWTAAWHASRDLALTLVGLSFWLLAFAPYWLVAMAAIALAVLQARRRLRAASATR